MSTSGQRFSPISSAGGLPAPRLTIGRFIDGVDYNNGPLKVRELHATVAVPLPDLPAGQQYRIWWGRTHRKSHKKVANQGFYEPRKAWSPWSSSDPASRGGAAAGGNAASWPAHVANAVPNLIPLVNGGVGRTSLPCPIGTFFVSDSVDGLSSATASGGTGVSAFTVLTVAGSRHRRLFPRPNDFEMGGTKYGSGKRPAYSGQAYAPAQQWVGLAACIAVWDDINKRIVTSGPLSTQARAVITPGQLAESKDRYAVSASINSDVLGAPVAIDVTFGSGSW